MNPNVITFAGHALQLAPISVSHPMTFSRATRIGPDSEILTLLETAAQSVANELAEWFRTVDAVVQEGQVAYVTPTQNLETPYGAVVADANGQLLATAVGRTKRGLAELIRLQLAALPIPVGSGESRA